MVAITQLWMPILVSAVIVFVVSAIIHMVLPIHRNEYQKLGAEDEVMEALRKAGVGSGEYMVPHPGSMAGMREPAFVEKRTKGPVAMITVLPAGPPGMGKNLFQWFVYTILIGLFAAYIAGRALGPGAPYRSVFRFAGCTAFTGYSLAILQASIWGGRPWSTTLKHVVDGLVYGLMTGGTFGWLWPR